LDRSRCIFTSIQGWSGDRFGWLYSCVPYEGLYRKRRPVLSSAWASFNFFNLVRVCLGLQTFRPERKPPKRVAAKQIRPHAGVERKPHDMPGTGHVDVRSIEIMGAGAVLAHLLRFKHMPIRHHKGIASGRNTANETCAVRQKVGTRTAFAFSGSSSTSSIKRGPQNAICRLSQKWSGGSSKTL